MSTPNYCVMCGEPIPENQGSRTCSMCYGDIDHGKDGYYRNWLEQENDRRNEPYERSGWPPLEVEP